MIQRLAQAKADGDNALAKKLVHRLYTNPNAWVTCESDHGSKLS